jgi:hypothetical protein
MLNGHPDDHYVLYGSGEECLTEFGDDTSAGREQV